MIDPGPIILLSETEPKVVLSPVELVGIAFISTPLMIVLAVKKVIGYYELLWCEPELSLISIDYIQSMHIFLRV